MNLMDDSSNTSLDGIPLKQGVGHTVALPFTLKMILQQKKNYGNSNISPCKNIILKNNPLKKTKIVQDIITL
jgi:hypothetical protein